MKFNYYTETSVIATPKTTAQGIAGSVGVIVGESNGPLGQQYAAQLRDETGSLAEVWVVNEADLTSTGRTFTREQIRGNSPFSIGVRPQRYTDDDPPPAR